MYSRWGGAAGTGFRDQPPLRVVVIDGVALGVGLSDTLVQVAYQNDLQEHLFNLKFYREHPFYVDGRVASKKMLLVRLGTLVQ